MEETLPLFLQCLCGGEPSVTVLWHQCATNIMESSLLETLPSGFHAEKGNYELSNFFHRIARKQNWVKFDYVWVQAKGSFSTLLVFTGEMHQKVSPLVNSCQQWYWRNVSPSQNDTKGKFANICPIHIVSWGTGIYCYKKWWRILDVRDWDLAQNLSARRKHPLHITPCIWISTYLKIHLSGFRSKSLWKTVCVLGILDAKLSCFCSVLFNCWINQLQLLKTLEGRM